MVRKTKNEKLMARKEETSNNMRKILDEWPCGHQDYADTYGISVNKLRHWLYGFSTPRSRDDIMLYDKMVKDYESGRHM